MVLNLSSMKHPNTFLPIDHTLLQLTDDEVANPFPILTDLYKTYRLQDLQEALAGITDIMLLLPNAFKDPEDRADFRELMQKIEKALEADYVIALTYLKRPVLSN